MSSLLGNPARPQSQSAADNKSGSGSGSGSGGNSGSGSAAAAIAVNPTVPCFIPGNSGQVVHYWLYPICVSDPAAVITQLNALGIDAYRGATQLALVPPPPTQWRQIVTEAAAARATATATAANGGEQPPVSQSTIESLCVSLEPQNARYLMDHIVYLPVHKRVPNEAIIKLARAVRFVLDKYSPAHPVFPRDAPTNGGAATVLRSRL